MTGGSDRVAGIEPLTIRQLEDRLQLAMAVSNHLATQRGVSRNDVRVAMESLEVQLPADAPLNSFTEQPSRCGYITFTDVIRAEEEALLARMLKRVKGELTYTLGDISTHIHTAKVSWEDRYQLLKVVQKYITFRDYQLPDNHADEQVQKELAVIHEAMEHWHNTKQLGQDVINFDRLYQRAFVLWESVQNALGQGLKLSDEDEKSLLNSIEGFTAAARQASHIDQEEVWSPTDLVMKTLKFMESFCGPIPYKLQPATSVEKMMREIQDFDDTRTLQSMLLLARAIESYLSWCWKLESTRIIAMDCSITICRQAGVVRAMAA